MNLSSVDALRAMRHTAAEYGRETRSYLNSADLNECMGYPELAAEMVARAAATARHAWHFAAIADAMAEAA